MPRTLGAEAKSIVGKNLKAARQRRGLSQTDAATRARVRRDRLNRWEKGRELIGVEGLLALAVTYGCAIDDFLGGVDEGYDTIIESRFPPDVRQHYASITDAFIARTTAAMQLALTGPVPAPTPTTTAASRPTTAETSGSVRARRTPKKKT